MDLDTLVVIVLLCIILGIIIAIFAYPNPDTTISQVKSDINGLREDANSKINDINTIFSLEDNLGMPALRILADKLKEKLSCAVIVLGSTDREQKKAFLVVAVTADLLSQGMDAGALIRPAALLIGGSGGGRGDFAQAGGTQPENFTLAFEKIRDIIKSSE